MQSRILQKRSRLAIRLKKEIRRFGVMDFYSEKRFGQVSYATLPPQRGNYFSHQTLSSDLYYPHHLGDCDYNNVWHSESVCSGLKDWCALLRKRQWVQGRDGRTLPEHTSVICLFSCQLNPFCLQKVSLSRISKPALFLDWPSCIFEIIPWIVKSVSQTQGSNF